jgi:hypothetical protein
MNTVIKKYTIIFSYSGFMFMFLVKAQAQVVDDIAKYQSPQPVLQQTEILMSIAKKDSVIISNSSTLVTKAAKIIGSLQQRFQIFTDLAENEIYQITIAADVPDNKRPGKVFYKKEPGHVFVILEQKDTVTKKSILQAWGFYPEHAISSLFVRTVKCKILDNSNRVYDAAIIQPLTKEQFEMVKQKAVELTSKKYNLNKYNCYDYAVEIFNAIPGVEDLSLVKVKFPLVFGRGGSPCGLYKQLVKLKNRNNRIAITVN